MAVGYLADEVATRLRAHKLYSAAVQVMIKDSKLKSITRQKQLLYSTNLSKNIVKHAMELIVEHWQMTKPIRMLTITALALSDTPTAEQLNLFEEKARDDTRREQLEKSIDKIKNKYGKTSILEASALHNDIGIEGEAKPEKEH